MIIYFEKTSYMKIIVLVNIFFLFLTGCSASQQQGEDTSDQNAQLASVSNNTETATIAGGCFWCIEAPFEKIEGVISSVSGYAGGDEKNPTYKAVASGQTSHRESVQVTYDPEIISYSEILDIFWKQFDPTDPGGSFYDRGTQYTSAIFYHNEEQRKVAEASKQQLDDSGIFDKPIVTDILELNAFYQAEDYHQDYYKKKPDHYQSYRKGSGRDKFIEKHWEVPSKAKYEKPDDSVLKDRLSDIEYEVTMKDGTERAFNNPLWDNKAKGLYVCIVSGAPLFSSKEKYKSGSGWPSFTKPIDARYLEKVIDKSYGMTRIEIRSKHGKSHLGHVFSDGPEPTGLRYCMNSAAMRFIPKEEMKKEGYGHYLWLVD